MSVDKKMIAKLNMLIEENPDLEVEVLGFSIYNDEDDYGLDLSQYNWDKVCVDQYCIVDDEYFLMSEDYKYLIDNWILREESKHQDLDSRELMQKAIDSVNSYSWKKVILIFLELEKTCSKGI